MQTANHDETPTEDDATEGKELPKVPAEPTFSDLGLSVPLLESLERLGFVTPTPIQSTAIPALLEGRDLMGQARTGTGKTAAFGLPMLQSLKSDIRAVQAVALAPTRELAQQVAKACLTFGSQMGGLRVTTVYGGTPMGPQMRELDRGTHVVVGTPGRMLDMLKRGVLSFEHVKFFVLDEADEMLQMGFIDDIEAILGYVPEDAECQMALFSATLSPGIRRIARKYLKDPVDAKVTGGQVAAPDIKQQLIFTRQSDKRQVLDRLLEVEEVGSALVFSRTKAGCAELAEWMERRGHPAAAIHGDLSQALRERVLRRFRSGAIKLLVATDVAARGLDIDHVTHVINFDPPMDPDSYVHRIGRTGRAGRSGVAITLATSRDRRFIHQIERRIKQRLEVRQPPSTEDLRARRVEQLVDALVAGVSKITANDPYLEIVERITAAGVSPVQLAAAAARLFSGDRALEPVKASRRLGVDEVGFIVTAGSRNRIRPGDVVGAFCNELGIPKDAIGSVEVGDTQSEIWIAAQHADSVRARSRKLKLRGRPVRVIPTDQFDPSRAPRPSGARPAERKGKGRFREDRRPSTGERAPARHGMRGDKPPRKRGKAPSPAAE